MRPLRGSPAPGQRKPRFRQTLAKDQHGRAGFVEVVFDARFPDFLRHGGRIFRGECAVQHPEVAVVLPFQESEYGGAHQNRHQISEICCVRLSEVQIRVS